VDRGRRLLLCLCSFALERHAAKNCRAFASAEVYLLLFVWRERMRAAKSLRVITTAFEFFLAPLSQVRGELVADLRAQVPHWATLREAAASRHRNDSLLVTDFRINGSDWQEGVQVHMAAILI